MPLMHYRYGSRLPVPDAVKAKVGQMGQGYLIAILEKKNDLVVVWKNVRVLHCNLPFNYAS